MPRYLVTIPVSYSAAVLAPDVETAIKMGCELPLEALTIDDPQPARVPENCYAEELGDARDELRTFTRLPGETDWAEHGDGKHWSRRFARPGLPPTSDGCDTVVLTRLSPFYYQATFAFGAFLRMAPFNQSSLTNAMHMVDAHIHSEIDRIRLGLKPLQN